jgi:putative flippase GtrA
VRHIGAQRFREAFAGHGTRMAKYFAGSVIATFVSTGTLVALFQLALVGSRAASLSGSAAGAVVNYYLNRSWTWERRGRADFRRELVPYWGTVVVTAVIAAVAVGAVNALVGHLTEDRPIQTAANVVTFLGVYGVSFFVKYRVFDQLFRLHAPEVQPAACAAASEAGPRT